MDFSGHSCFFRISNQKEHDFCRIICQECHGGRQISRQSCGSRLCIGCWVEKCIKEKWNPNLSECLNRACMKRSIDPQLVDEWNVFKLDFFTKENWRSAKVYRHVSDTYLKLREYVEKEKRKDQRDTNYDDEETNSDDETDEEDDESDYHTESDESSEDE